MGVAEFDGAGGVTRIVRVNAEAADGGRVLIDLTSVGTYSVNEDGTGVVVFTNTLPDGSTRDATFDFVIRKSSGARSQGAALADELFAIDREPGITASPVTESFTRRAGLR